MGRMGKLHGDLPKGCLVGGEWLPSILFSQKYWVSNIIPIDGLIYFLEWGGPSTNQTYNEESENGLFGRVSNWDHLELQFDQAV